MSLTAECVCKQIDILVIESINSAFRLIFNHLPISNLFLCFKEMFKNILTYDVHFSIEHGKQPCNICRIWIHYRSVQGYSYFVLYFYKLTNIFITFIFNHCHRHFQNIYIQIFISYFRVFTDL